MKDSTQEKSTLFLKLLKKTKRKGVKKLLAALEDVGFFSAPCSGGNHLCCVGGLAEHSLNVYMVAHKMAKALLSPADYNAMSASITIAALLHDVGKCGAFGEPMYIENVLKSGKPSATKPFKRNKEISAIPHSSLSVSFLSGLITLSNDEYQAVLFHDGLYGEFGYCVKGHETALYQLIHSADLWCSRIIESHTSADDSDDSDE